MSTQDNVVQRIDTGDVVEGTSRVGPYRLILELEKVEDGTFRVVHKGVEQLRPVLLSSMGRISNKIHSFMYDSLVTGTYSLGDTVDASEAANLVK